MPRPRFDSADPELKKRLLDAAIGELAANGYEAASLNRILERAEMSKGSFYYYFEDKADLAVAVVVAVIDDVYPPIGLGPCHDAPTYWAAFGVWQHEVLRVFFSNRAKADAVMRVGIAMLKDDAMRARVMPLVATKGQDFTRFMEIGQEIGAVRRDMAPHVLIAVAQSMKDGLSRVLLPTDRTPTPEEIERFSDLVLELLRRIAEPKGTP